MALAADNTLSATQLDEKYKKQDYLVSKTVILIQKTLHFVFYQKHAKKIEKPLALI